MNTKNVLIGGALLAASAVVLWNTRRTIPKRAIAVKPFEPDLFLGKWYEVARLDFRFERTKRNTTIEYSLNEDGSLRVVNKGYDYSKRKRVITIGKAKFVGVANEAKMMISYFKGLSFGYNVIGIDPEYKYALVAGEDLRHLWFLSREPDMPEDIKETFIRKALIIGYDIRKLVWVEHDPIAGLRCLIDEYTQIDQDLI